MNKWMLASITLLVAGGFALPVEAQDNRGRGGDTADSDRNRSGNHAELNNRRANRDENRGDESGEHHLFTGPRQGHDRRIDRRDSRYDYRYDRRDWRHDRRDDRRDWRHDRRHDHRRYARGHDRRWHGYNWHPQYRYRAPVRYTYPRGYRAQQWHVGYRLPPSYYHSRYYVDYRNYYLPPPPYGYHWVRVDRDVVLVSIASGLIRDILYGLYY